jgi:hypothetical protein
VGVQEASVWGAASPAPVDRALLIGSVFFGVGWGATGLCPGPLLVGVGASGAPGLLLMLFAMALGMALAHPISKMGYHGDSYQEIGCSGFEAQGGFSKQVDAHTD